MAFKGRLVLVGALLIGASALIGCSQPPAGQDVASKPEPAAEKLEINEIVVRPVGKASDTPLRPAFPKDRLEIAFKTKGSAARAELSVKMIALAGGRTVRTDKVRLSAANAPVPSMYFEPSPEWTPGRYLFEVSLNGQLAGSQELEIFPEDVAEPARP